MKILKHWCYQIGAGTYTKKKGLKIAFGLVMIIIDDDDDDENTQLLEKSVVYWFD